jgi:hypothetical protein
MPSKVKTISKEDLQNLHTGTLMKRRKKLLACEESFQLSDRFGYEVEPIPDETGYVEFKDTEAWKLAYSELKEVLSNRENWPGKHERKTTRIKKV